MNPRDTVRENLRQKTKESAKTGLIPVSQGTEIIMSFTPTTYLKSELTEAQRPESRDKWLFAGIDLAPNDMLETGTVVVDREKTILRMDKLGSDEQILAFVSGLGPPRSLVVALDVPKSLSIQGRWRQQEVKMFPFRLEREAEKKQLEALNIGTEPHVFEEGRQIENEAFTNRWSERAWTLYRTLTERGVCVLLYFNHLAKPRYGLSIPFRTRTPRGCKALQATIRKHLTLQDMPTNLAPSSVLDAMVGAYTAWTFYKGTYGEHYQLFWDRESCMMLEPLKRVV